MATRIEKTDLARDALYDKVNTMIDEVKDESSRIVSIMDTKQDLVTYDSTNERLVL